MARYPNTKAELRQECDHATKMWECWQRRWRDKKEENEQLRSFLREIIGFMDINRIESMDAEDAKAWLQAHKEE